MRRQMHSDTVQPTEQRDLKQSQRQNWNEIFNQPTAKDIIEPENQFTFVESSDNEFLKPEDLGPLQQTETYRKKKAKKSTHDTAGAKRSSPRKAPTKSPNFRQLNHNSAGVGTMNFSRQIRGGGIKSSGTTSKATLDQQTNGSRSSKQARSIRTEPQSSNVSSSQQFKDQRR